MYLGIDLGTTNSVAVIYNGKTNEIEAVPVDGGEEVIPSAVNFLDSEIIVGSEAKSGAIIYPESTILSIKRLMGQDETLIINEKECLPEEVSAEILKKLKLEAESYANTTFDEVVITHPAYFNDKQIYATKQAGYLAGFKTIFLLSEPLAAAIEYGYKNGYAQTILVYDMGGGTFDVSVLKVSVDENGQEIFQELATLGDMNLGGDDFDSELIRYFKNAFKEQHSIDIDELEDNLERKRLIQKLKLEAEVTKKKLSNVNKTNVSISPLLIHNDIPKNLNIEITKEDFEAIIRKYVERTKDIIEETLKRAKRTPDQINKVILVGGSTLIPMVKRAIAGMVKEPYFSLDPAKSVAMGAAIYNYLIHLPGGNVSVQQITRQVLGTMAVVNTNTMERKLIPIIPMGSPIPTAITDSKFTNMSGSNTVTVPIYQWENGYEDERKYIGSVNINKLKGEAQIELTYSINENNLFEVHIKDLKTGLSQSSVFDRNKTENEPEASQNISASNVNVVFIIDTTGSMETYINGVKDRAITFAKILKEKDIQFKLGLIGFGDLNEGEKTIVHGFTNDIDKFKNQVKGLPAYYGGDIPEHSLDALETAISLIKTSEDGTNIFILITDAHSHLPTKNGNTQDDIASILQEKNITTYVVSREDKESHHCYDVLVKNNGKYYSMNQEFYDILDNIAKSITELVRI